MEPLLLRPVEAAHLIGISRSKFYELLRAGAIPGFVKIGRSRRVSRAALEAWVAQQTAEEEPGWSPQR
ncbi:MAG: helix-turn-helix transcriptional regulator [Dehalococcoidia bacterium]